MSDAIVSAWTSLSESEKSKYDTTSKSAKSEADAAYSEWYKALSKDNIASIENATGVKVRSPGGKRASKARSIEAEKAAGAPPRPLTGYFLFQKELRAKKEDDGTSITDFAKKSGAAWKSLSESEKKVSLSFYTDIMGLKSRDKC